MKNYTIIDENGQVITSGTSMHLDLPMLPGQTLLKDVIAPIGTYKEGDAWIKVPPQPSMRHVFDWPTKQWIDPRTLEELRADQQRAIDAAFSSAAGALTAGYPLLERQTWNVQQAEALAWAANPSAPTPFLDGIAAARGITPEDMRAKTLSAVQAFLQASQQLVGTRQRLRDAIAAAGSRAEIEAIRWPE